MTGSLTDSDLLLLWGLETTGIHLIIAADAELTLLLKIRKGPRNTPS